MYMAKLCSWLVVNT